jgi:hypothetical protein
LQPSSSITLENDPTIGQAKNHPHQPANSQQKKDKKRKCHQKQSPLLLWK